MHPEDINRTINLCTGLIFNNFDRFVNTSSEKDNLHDNEKLLKNYFQFLLQLLHRR